MRTTAGIVAGVIEVAAFAVLAVLALTPSRRPGAGAPPLRVPTAWTGCWTGSREPLGGGRLSVIALVLLGAAVAGAGAAATASAGGG